MAPSWVCLPLSLRIDCACDFFADVLGTVSLGKPSSAALEKLCADTEALLDQASGKPGSATAFVSTQWDFLREGER